MEIIERITRAEERLNRAKAAIRLANEALEALEKARDDFALVNSYYGSPDWFADLAAYDNNELGADRSTVPAGILSEDSAYNMLTDYNELAIEMSRMAGEMLEKGY